MHDDPVGDEFIQDLALAGHEGTVADRMRGTAADGRCRTKTGTLTGVSALSGYCFNGNGRTMVFSILMNNVSDLGLAHLDQDRIAGWSPLLLKQRPQAGFVEDLGPQLLGLGELRARALAGDHVVGLLRDRAGDLAAGPLDQRRWPPRGSGWAGCRSGPASCPPAGRPGGGARPSPAPAAQALLAQRSISSLVRSSASVSVICTAMIGPTPSTSSICSGSARRAGRRSSRSGRPAPPPSRSRRPAGRARRGRG